jgi:hypothetical protein
MGVQKTMIRTFNIIERMMMKKILLYIIFGLVTVKAQSIVSGSVQDAGTHEPLAFVRIFIDSSMIAHTNTKGVYSFSISEGKHAIEFRVLGYQTFIESISIHQKDTISLHVLMMPAAYVLQAVTVTAERVALSSINGLSGVSIEPKELQRINGPFDDIFRSIQGIAGVATNNEMSSRLQIRGGLSDENLILLNGGQVLEPFHLKEFPGASLTTINSELLKRAEFFPGGFPARYGDRISAVLDLEYREGDPDRMKGSVSASLSDGSVLVEGPLAKNATGLLNVRSTYSDYIAKYLVESGQRSPRFYDVQGIIGWDVAANQHLSLHLIQSHDQTSGLTNGEYNSVVAGGTYNASLSERSSITGTLSLYHQTDNLKRSVFIYRDLKDVDITLREAKISMHHWVSEIYDILIGIEAV